MRVKDFGLAVSLSAEFLRAEPRIAEELARQDIADAARLALVGPRGGKYEPIGLPYGFLLRPDVDMDRYVLTARVRGRYVRPHR